VTPRAYLIAAGAALYGPRWQSALAADLGVTDRTIRNLISRGQLQARRIGNSRMIRIDRADLEAILQPIPTTGGDK